MRCKYVFVSLLFSFVHATGFGQATWIWYPGDFEIWLSNQVQNRRTERFAFVPPFWRVYHHHPQVNFSTAFELKEPEEIAVAVEGKYNVTVDGRYIQGDVQHITLPTGKHNINFQVFNDVTPPAIWVKGKTVFSNDAWHVELVHNNSPDNLAANAIPTTADAWNFGRREELPSQYRLPTKEVNGVRTEQNGKTILIDAGRETFGFLTLKNLQGSGKLSFYYGESKEEALSVDSCETFDHYTLSQPSPADYTTNHSRAFRFVNVVTDGAIRWNEVAIQEEYLPLALRGTFKSSDEELNNIWNVSARTLQLNTREFFLDGIKRDRWVWAGDAVQSFLMNYYLFFDKDVVKRTTWALRGADPVEAHINTILDYSLYWFTGIYDYYKYTGDSAFLKRVYPRMVTLMEYCLKRRNKDGMLEGLPGDWVFLDWAPMSKDGELSAIQMLFARSLEAMSLSASLMKDDNRAQEYQKLSENLKGKIKNIFWDPGLKAFVHSRKNGQLNRQVTRYANMFALVFGYLDSTEIENVRKNVLLNDQVLKITTPYMRFYELEALSEIGQLAYVTQEMKNYWGGMLKEGATSFWEFYDPAEKGAARYAMYGRPYGKSLCHAWGASPIYLIGKYYLGVKPLTAGYSTYIVQPNLGGLEWIEGSVPTPNGDVEVTMNKKQIRLRTAGGNGILKIESAKTPVCKNGTIVKKGVGQYELALAPNSDYTIFYTPVSAKTNSGN